MLCAVLGTPADAAFRSVPMPYHIHIVSTVVVCCVAMDTSAAGQLEGEAVRRARACPDKQEPLAPPNSTTSDGIFQNRLERRHETGA